MKRVFLLLLSSVYFFVSPITVQCKSLSSVGEAFQKSGLSLSEFHVCGWVKLSKPCSDNETLNSAAKCLTAAVTGCEGTLSMEPGPDMACIRSSFLDGDIVVTIKNSINAYSGMHESTAFVDVTQIKGYGNINDIGDRIEKVLRKYGKKPCINVLIRGYADGKLDDDRKICILNNIIKYLHAADIHTINEDNLISISAYSSILPYSVDACGEKINVNTACRYSSYDKRTYFWLGTPVINTEY